MTPSDKAEAERRYPGEAPGLMEKPSLLTKGEVRFVVRTAFVAGAKFGREDERAALAAAGPAAGVGEEVTHEMIVAAIEKFPAPPRAALAAAGPAADEALRALASEAGPAEGER